MSSSPRVAVLMVFPWCLDRVGHGNVQRVLGMAAYLSHQGVDVDLVYQGNPRVASREHELQGFRRVIRVAGWESSDDTRIHAAWEAFYDGHDAPSWNLCPGSALTAMVRSLLDAVEYTAVVSSYAWTAPIFDGMAGRVLRLVDLHDILSDHVARCRQATGRDAPFVLASETERFLWQHWDGLLAITAEEAAVIAPTLRPEQQLLTVPHAVAIAPQQRHPEPDTIVYTGSDNHSNRAAVTWLLTEVWPHVLAERPAATLRLVGLVCDALRPTPLGATPNVEWTGLVDNPFAELAKASVCVAPYLYGSGLKIKVVEAAAAGCPIVTTTAGAEGSGLRRGRHVLVEDDPVAFAAAVVHALDDDALRAQLGSEAQAHAREAFAGTACYGALLALLRRHCAAAPASGLVPSAVERRLRFLLLALDMPSIVLWGNGSHTRALVPVLRSLGADIRCIVDASVQAPAESAEGLPVVPSGAFSAVDGDLVVLSSQMYEPEMWHDLAGVRANGTDVVALYHRDLVTAGVRQCLRAAAAPPAPRPRRRDARDVDLLYR